MIIKNAGHALNAEKPKEMYKHMKSFLIDTLPPTKQGNCTNGHKADWNVRKQQMTLGVLDPSVEPKFRKICLAVEDSIVSLDEGTLLDLKPELNQRKRY